MNAKSPIRLYALIPLLLISLISRSAEYNMRALVTDTAGVAQEFATWRIFAETDTVRPVAGALTGADGMITAALPSPTNYRLEIWGMDSTHANMEFSMSDSTAVNDLGEIILLPVSTELAELTVSAQRPIVIREIDRIGYDVSADPDTRTMQLNEVLRRVPLVTVDEDGTIRVNGSTNFKIYKNGRPNNAYTKNAKDLFKAIPASTIRKVEVITDPGAREDAEGSAPILNIVTDRNTMMRGVTGTASMRIDTRSLIPQPNLYLTSQLGKVTFDVHAGMFGQTRHQSNSYDSSTTIYHDSGNVLTTESESTTRYLGTYGGLELSYEIDTLNLITAEGNFFNYDLSMKTLGSHSNYNSAGDLISFYKTSSHTPSYGYLDFDGALNYQRNTRLKDETITLSYRIATTRQNQDRVDEFSELFNPPMLYTGIDSKFDLRFIEHTLQLDWARPLGKNQKLDAGGKYIIRNNHSINNREYIGVTQTEDRFRHRTSIGAIYADYRIKFGKFGARAGIRYEFSHLDAHFYTGDQRSWGSWLHDYAPNASVNWDINDGNSIKLSYNRTISRPGINYLDPTVSESPYSTSSGNPYLNSQSFNNIQFNYNLIHQKVNLDLTLNYSLSNDMIGTIMEVKGDHTYSTYGNINKYKRLGAWLYMRYTPWAKTTWTLNLGTYRASYRNVDDGAHIARWRINFYTSVRQSLPWKLNLTLGAYYFSGQASSAYTYSSSPAKDIGYSLYIQRTFLKEDRLTVGLSTQSPFRKWDHYNSTTIAPGYHSTTTNRYMDRVPLALYISYRFGSLNAYVKKTAAKIQNDDLEGGKK